MKTSSPLTSTSRSQETSSMAKIKKVKRKKNNPQRTHLKSRIFLGSYLGNIKLIATQKALRNEEWLMSNSKATKPYSMIREEDKQKRSVLGFAKCLIN